MLNAFLSGGTAVACGIIGVCFFRYWRRSGLRLFLLFSLSFMLLTLERAVLAVANPDTEFVAYIYLIRLTAFLVIIVAIIDQNRTRR
jgi:hypothetical protein